MTKNYDIFVIIKVNMCDHTITESFSNISRKTYNGIKNILTHPYTMELCLSVMDVLVIFSSKNEEITDMALDRIKTRNQKIIFDLQTQNN